MCFEVGDYRPHYSGCYFYRGAMVRAQLMTWRVHEWQNPHHVSWGRIGVTHTQHLKCYNDHTDRSLTKTWPFRLNDPIISWSATYVDIGTIKLYLYPLRWLICKFWMAWHCCGWFLITGLCYFLPAFWAHLHLCLILSQFYIFTTWHIQHWINRISP